MRLRSFLSTAAAGALLLLFSGSVAAQSVPQAFNYQGIAREADGSPVVNSDIAVRLTISGAGSDLYIETHGASTNPFGLFTLQVGNGTVVSGDFSAIDWTSGPKSLEVEVDLGEGEFVNVGSSPLLSVPYALAAGTVDGLSIGDLDDVVTPAPTAGQTLVFDGEDWVARTPGAGLELPATLSGRTLLDTALLRIIQTGTGPALGLVSNPQAISPTLRTIGLGTGSAFRAIASGENNNAGEFRVTNTRSVGAPVEAYTVGGGSAGRFMINNRDSDSAAVYGYTNGTGYGLLGVSSSPGRTYGVYGVALEDCRTDQTGLRADCPTGVFGQSRFGPGVVGYSSGRGPGLVGYSETGLIIEGRGPTAVPGFHQTEFWVNNRGRLWAEDGLYSNTTHSSGRNGFAELITSADTALGVGDIAVVSSGGSFAASRDTNATAVVGVVVETAGFLGGNGLDSVGTVLTTGGYHLAVAGFVMLNVSDEGGSIAPGDLLVTSAETGHAMLAPADPAPGTVVAKALESFAAGGGTGTIRALVMLR